MGFDFERSFVWDICDFEQKGAVWEIVEMSLFCEDSVCLLFYDFNTSKVIQITEEALSSLVYSASHSSQ